MAGFLRLQGREAKASRAAALPIFSELDTQGERIGRAGDGVTAGVLNVSIPGPAPIAPLVARQLERRLGREHAADRLQGLLASFMSGIIGISDAEGKAGHGLAREPDGFLRLNGAALPFAGHHRPGAAEITTAFSDGAEDETQIGRAHV